jgi:hypothetical protein
MEIIITKDAKYKFDINLLKASFSQIIENAKKEWNIIYEEKRENNDGLCICQRKVKNIIYMYNIITKNTIIVGSTCCKKFNMSNNILNNKILTNILKNSLTKGEYTNIDNIITYCQSVEEQLLNYFQTNFEKIIENIEKNTLEEDRYFSSYSYCCQELKSLSTDINELIQSYNLNYLDNIYILITTRLNKLVEEIYNYEKSLIYCVKTYTENRIPGQGRDTIEYKKYFNNLEKCQNYINGLPPIGYTKYSGYNNEDTLLKIEILLNNQIIKEITKPTIYCVKLYIEKYQHEIRSILEYEKCFYTLEKCENYIMKLPLIGFTKKNYANHLCDYSEDTILKIEILLNNQIIKKINDTNNIKNLDEINI